MIISHRHKFIFLHARKCAGSSITLLLNPHLGPRDIQVGVHNETQGSGGRLNRAALLTAMSEPGAFLRASARLSLRKRRPRWSHKAAQDIIKRHYRARFGERQPTHVSAAKLREVFPDAWARYHKFSVVRNPWTHAVSDYYWRLSITKTTEVSFRQFLDLLDDRTRPDPHHMRPPALANWPIYAIDGEVVLDEVLRFETLADDLAALGDRLGLPLDLTAARSKTTVRPAKVPVADHYDDEAIDIVARVYRPVIDAFGYDVPF